MTDTQVTLKMIWWLYLIYAGFLIELHVKCGQRFIQYETLTDVKTLHFAFFPSLNSADRQQSPTQQQLKFTVKIYGKKMAAVVNLKIRFSFYGFNLNLQLNTIISLTDIMLIYQPIEVLKSVLYLCNTLITTKCRRWWESHDEPFTFTLCI